PDSSPDTKYRATRPSARTQKSYRCAPSPSALRPKSTATRTHCTTAAPAADNQPAEQLPLPRPEPAPGSLPQRPDPPCSTSGTPKPSRPRRRTAQNGSPAAAARTAADRHFSPSPKVTPCSCRGTPVPC